MNIIYSDFKEQWGNIFFYNTVNFQPVTFRILFFRGIQTLQMRLSRKACFWWTRPFCRAADELCRHHETQVKARLWKSRSNLDQHFISLLLVFPNVLLIRCASGYFPSDVHVYFMISLKVVNILSNSTCKFDLGTNNQSSTYYAFSCADKFSQKLTNKKNCVILSGVAQ